MNTYNFNSPEFTKLWNFFYSFLVSKYKTGRGRRSDVTAKHGFFIVLTVLKHGGQLDFLASIFTKKDPTFEKHIVTYVNMLHEYVYECLVLKEGQKYKIKEHQMTKTLFANYKYAHHATDVTFQQTCRPSGDVQEGKLYYCGKHK